MFNLLKRFFLFILILTFNSFLVGDQNNYGLEILKKTDKNMSGYGDSQSRLVMQLINAKGEIFIQETKVEYEKIIAKIMAVSNNRTDTRIFVRGDKTINYGRVLEVMGRLSGAGFSKVALISEPYKN